MQRAVRKVAAVVVAAAALWVSGAAADESDQTSAPADSAAPTAPPTHTQSSPGEAQRKALIVANVVFGKDEGDGFWPLYRDYRRDVGKLQDQRAKVVGQYAEIFRTMTDEQAKSIVEDSLQIDESIAKLKRDYLKKFRKFLPETKIARVFMIDDKINAAVAAELLIKVPTAGDSATP